MLNSTDAASIGISLEEEWCTLEGVGTERERWLLSYADLLTLLFALFVVLFASMAARKASPSAALPSVPRASSPKQELKRMDTLLQERLQSAIRDGKIETRLEGRGLVMELNDASFFLPADDQVRPEMRHELEEIVTVLSPWPNRISVEGHADASPIRSPRFSDNWQLSAARSLAVVRYLTDDLHLPVSRVSAAAFADTRPRSANDSAWGRARNRRVDIVVFNTAENSAE